MTKDADEGMRSRWNEDWKDESNGRKIGRRKNKMEGRLEEGRIKWKEDWKEIVIG